MIVFAYLENGHKLDMNLTRINTGHTCHDAGNVLRASSVLCVSALSNM